MRIDARMPQSSAWPALLAALLGLALVAIGGEWVLARRGFVATAVDSEELWVRQRSAAADARSIAILGSSRAQVGIDLDVVARITGRPAIQLAIDNSSFLPVLAGLAEDPDYAGTVIVDFLERYLVANQRDELARAWEAAYQRQARLAGRSPSAGSEAWLGAAVRSRLRLYADGAQPISNLLMRALVPGDSPQYLLMLPNRSRLADYAQVQMPHFYLRTVARYLGVPLDQLPWANGVAAVESALRAEIAAQALPDVAAIEAGIAAVSALARRIEQRGGRVFFVRMPSCGLILEAEQRWYPRARYWDALAAANPGRTVHFADHPELARIGCPDGSHIDRSEVAAFTAALLERIPVSASP